MTEAEWNACTDPQPMREFLQDWRWWWWFSPAGSARKWKFMRILLDPCEAVPGSDEEERMHRTEAERIRCIYGPLPFRRVKPDRTWLTSSVTLLAEAMYADRAFDRLPILADALEEAGCTNADILTHCRQPGKHAWGCWVIDLLTGRK